ncbi:M20/M25/M40 family metallo-hydrolase [Streptomyces sp. NBRC 109706]|uniref:M20/M25/M40 family metallo-hydrolase n=1 Tax=Streptomyces sp. NBRC 109706 TaxID=1550035 RepID=UPI000781B729|nr:M20/M25/M40 family metallo-hydrolase [Streptomyces sp. NBRC 109706]
MISVLVTALTPLLAVGLLFAPGADDPLARGEELADRMTAGTTAAGTLRHLAAFQAVAEANEGHRAAGSPGHEESARYAGTLLADAGYLVSYQRFAFPYREPLAEKLTLLTPEERDIPVKAMSYTGNTEEGGRTAPLAEAHAHGDGGAGCAAEDFADRDWHGLVALVRRGDCTFATKQAHAAEAGAVGVLVYNTGPGQLSGTLGDPDPNAVPTGGISGTDGEALSATLADTPADAPPPTVRLELRELVEERHTTNVIAETRTGDPSHVVLAGAHLDSVSHGPGINDNASGAAGVLEAALQLASAAPEGDHPHRMRFALWSAEELGLRGAEHYVENLSPTERDAIALYLNFDMIGSPNYGLFVYDGASHREDSALIADDLTAILGDQRQQARPTAFNDRSDYAPFLAAGIPAGGTYTGGDGIKTEEEAALWGGTAGEPYDPCYHRGCDDLENISPEALEINARTIAHAVGRYAWHTPVGPRGTDPETAAEQR